MSSEENQREDGSIAKSRREALGGAIGGLAMFGTAGLFTVARQSPLVLILAFITGVIAGSGTAGSWWSRPAT